VFLRLTEGKDGEDPECLRECDLGEKTTTTEMPRKYQIHTFITQRTNHRCFSLDVFPCRAYTCSRHPGHTVQTFHFSAYTYPLFSVFGATAHLPHPPSTSTAEIHLTIYSPPFPCPCPSSQSHHFPSSPLPQRFPSHLPSLHPCSPPPWSSW
jgi:hypothetical protein